MSKFQSTEKKIKSPLALKKALNREKKSGKKTVFTNGCFDILHRGHVGTLEQARKTGDLLVVALNSDSSIKKIKGPQRPIHQLEDRLKVIASLEAVDFVTWFEEDTPEKLLEKLQPDILIKGGDYTKDEVVGGEIVKAYGGKVKVLPFFAGHSTTGILKKRKKK
jgi:D-beta-D-heptose 7-phosphate kinase / D-beta-D-heptose 1-phosphate adenosyltransferase